MTPDYPTFCKFAARGNLVAVKKEIPADLETPVSCFLKLADGEPHAFLLESAEQEEKVGRYSFIGIRPEKVIRSDAERVVISARGQKTACPPKLHVTEVINAELASRRIANPEDMPAFSGGFVGYLSYENVVAFEDVKIFRKKPAGVPEAVFFECRQLVIFDHFRKTLTVAVLADVSGARNLAGAYRKADARIRRTMACLRRPLRLSRRSNRYAGLRPVSNMLPSEFSRKIQRIREYIRSGDCIQVVLSQRFTFPLRLESFQIYRALRSVNPSPYMFYFRTPEVCLVGSSPELLVRKTGREAEVRPIAGTRPRGKTAAADAALEEHLKKSPKEMAEHLMLVDLGRNDLGRVCRFDSIRVKNFARVERYSHVMHLVSDVVGRLKSGVTALDLLRATFPAGTVTGAPKIRAMEIINELEPSDRGPYAGCLGYFSYNGDMDMCITIRTLVLHRGRMDLQAGAGIVKDSNPVREYQETVNKASALLRAVQRAGDF